MSESNTNWGLVVRAVVFIFATLLLVPSTGSLAGVTAIVAYSVDLGFEVHRNSQDKRSQEQSDREIQDLRTQVRLLREEVQGLKPPEDKA